MVTLEADDVVLGRYRIVEPIAAGGLSRVYLGQDERLPRPVCIKVYHALAAGGEEGTSELDQIGYQYFVQEAFALSQLSHPNTLRIYDFGYVEAGDGAEAASRKTPVQVSEYMNGGTLSELVAARGSLASAEVLEIVTPLVGALAEAHAQGIIHRDLKPKNILFGWTGDERQPKLADFGIAEALHGVEDPRFRPDAASSRLPHLMYSLNWAAPEQLIWQTPVPATDIYSLGLLVLFMLTGKRPLQASDLREAIEQRSRISARIDELGAGCALPAALAELLRSACHPQIAERPQDDQCFLEALRLACAGSPGWRATSTVENLPDAVVVKDVPTSSIAPSGPRQRLRLGESAVVSGRSTRFLRPQPGGAELQLGDGGRLRVALVPDAGGGTCLQLRGLNCFVRLMDHPATSTVQIRRPGALTLISPGQRVVAEGTVDFGESADGCQVFLVGAEPVAVHTDHCRFISALDFGPSDDFVFIYAGTDGAPSSSEA